MLVITAPTGQIGKQVLALLLDHQDPIRVIVRDPIRLDPGVRGRVEIVQGSHDDPAILSRALKGADGLFWLVPPRRGRHQHGRALSWLHPTRCRRNPSSWRAACGRRLQRWTRLADPRWCAVGRVCDGRRDRAHRNGIPRAEHAVLHGEPTRATRRDPGARDVCPGVCPRPPAGHRRDARYRRDRWYREALRPAAQSGLIG